MKRTTKLRGIVPKPRSPFRDFWNKLHGGVHPDRRYLIERQQRKELRALQQVARITE